MSVLFFITFDTQSNFRTSLSIATLQQILGRFKVEYQMRVLPSVFCKSNTSILSKMNKLI